VLTVDVGIPKMLNVHKCERTAESIKKGISKFYTKPQVEEYSWEIVCKQFKEYYEQIAKKA
jgi:hypothetical protein